MDRERYITVEQMEEATASLLENGKKGGADSWQQRVKNQTPHCGFGDLVSQIENILALGLDAPLLRDALELFRILDGVVAALFRVVKGVADLAAVVGVRCGAACGKAQVVTADDAVHVAAADAARRLRRDAAGAHGANTAAGAGFTEAAVRGLVLCALLPGIRADLDAVFQQRGRGGFHLFHRD